MEPGLVPWVGLIELKGIPTKTFLGRALEMELLA